ncbi:hypothetical protein [Spirosoma endbachense]|uniref:Uncharacterized protein n=1 Tax=Spirosoma endbachense TaxID=2666025 RepID=A0A6P1W7A9_9BACT|nr:hypothetical protein [Spirosoma endbachense]QHV99800.1 hypothetical protein GJR95_34435 [Spirosoma endbachense]
MVVYSVAAVLIIASGCLSYLTSAWFGCQSSNTGLLPPHYRKLMNRFKPGRKKIEAKQEQLFD